MRLMVQCLAALLTTLPLAANAQVANSESQMTVEGNGVVSRSPDRARVDVEIVTSDDAAVRSGGKNTTTYDAFLARLGTLGIGAADIRTTSYNVTFVPNPPRDLPAEQRQPRYGYITSRSLSITVVPLEFVGKVVDAATASGVTQVGDVGFDLRDRRAAYLSAVAAAIQDAKATASAAVAAAGLHIVRIVRLDVDAQRREPVPGPVTYRRVALAAAAEPPTEIAPSGPIDVPAHVSITYEIR